MKSKKLSRIELDVVVNEILSKSNDLKLVKLKEKYNNEIEILNREIDLFKEKYDLLNEELIFKVRRYKFEFLLKMAITLMKRI